MDTTVEPSINRVLNQTHRTNSTVSDRDKLAYSLYHKTIL